MRLGLEVNRQGPTHLELVPNLSVHQRLGGRRAHAGGGGTMVAGAVAASRGALTSTRPQLPNEAIMLPIKRSMMSISALSLNYIRSRKKKAQRPRVRCHKPSEGVYMVNVDASFNHETAASGGQNHYSGLIRKP